MKRKIVSLIIINIILYCFFTNIKCYANFDFVSSEVAGNYEPVSVPDPPSADTGPGYAPDPDTPTVTTPSEPTLNITVPIAVQGYVFEDLERLETENDGSMAGTEHVTNNFTYNPGEPRVSGIEVAGKITDNNGAYSINSPGTYDISFTYGKLLDPDNYKLNKNTLKYNGQDYNMVVMGEGSSGYDKSYIRKIKEVDNSYTEVYIVIDHSASMRKTNSSGKTRLDIVKESAISFVKELFKEADGNLAVGYIAFGYEAVVIKKPTDVQKYVIDAIENFKVENGKGIYSGKEAPNFSSLNHKTGTNIGRAVVTARDSYLAPKSNKVMVLFSDGAATAHDDVTSLYADDTYSEMAVKLGQIATKTKSDLKSVVDSGITLINILNETEGTEREYVEKAFRDGGSWIGYYYEVNYSNAEAVANALLNDTKTIIEETESELLDYSEEYIFNGDDDPQRRKEVNEYYNEFYYEKLKILEIVTKLNGTESNDIDVIAKLLNNNINITQEKRALYRRFIEEGIYESDSALGEFINNSWMKTKPNSVTLYEISYDSSGRPSAVGGLCSFSYYTRDGVDYCRVTGGGLDGEYKEANVSVTGITITINAALVRRDEFKLELDQIVTGVRLTLSDGKVLYNMISDNAYETVNKNKEFKELYCKQLQKRSGLISDIDMKIKKLKINEVANFPNSIYLTVDTDLLQGATLEVEYTLVIKNNSRNAIFCRDFALVDYFDEGLVYRQDNQLLTEEGINADYNWSLVNLEDLHSSVKFVSDAVLKHNSKDKKCIYIDFYEEGYKMLENIPSDGNISNFEINSKYVNPVIGNNGERYVKVVLSRFLTPEIVNDLCFKNQAEILRYGNNNGRRENLIELTSVGSTIAKYPISGNYVPTDMMHTLEDYITNVHEIDTSVAKSVAVAPPTGKSMTRRYYIFLSLIVICSVFIMRRKIIINRKKDK